MTSKSSDRLLTEVERQEKYLAKPPNDFSFPSSMRPKRSRRSGYRNTAAAARETVDNATRPWRTALMSASPAPRPASRNNAPTRRSPEPGAEAGVRSPRATRTWRPDLQGQPRDQSRRPW